MSEHSAVIRWVRNEGEVFKDNQYSRAHFWEFDGGLTVPASPSPLVVPLPLSVEAKRKYVIDSYTDEAVGVLSKNSEGRAAVTKVVLRPHIVFSGDKIPNKEQLTKMHHLSHENCFIANSVKTEVITDIIA
ncbi:OsmC family peroxiredoxin [Vibrio parahaemolyticus]|nr:OsmC family peroxiredoxin [Vibrio parahaemolyticus]